MSGVALILILKKFNLNYSELLLTITPDSFNTSSNQIPILKSKFETESRKMIKRNEIPFLFFTFWFF